MYCNFFQKLKFQKYLFQRISMTWSLLKYVVPGISSYYCFYRLYFNSSFSKISFTSFEQHCIGSKVWTLVKKVKPQNPFYIILSAHKLLTFVIKSFLKSTPWMFSRSLPYFAKTLISSCVTIWMIKTIYVQRCWV